MFNIFRRVEKLELDKKLADIRKDNKLSDLWFEIEHLSEKNIFWIEENTFIVGLCYSGYHHFSTIEEASTFVWWINAWVKSYKVIVKNQEGRKNENTIRVDKEEYEKLLDSQAKLKKLMDYWVCSWSGYDNAMEWI